MHKLPLLGCENIPLILHCSLDHPTEIYFAVPLGEVFYPRKLEACGFLYDQRYGGFKVDLIKY